MRSDLLFHQLFDSESSTYTYLLADAGTKEAIIIDPVLEKLDRDLQLIKELELKLNYSLETHVHADHITAASEIRRATGAKIGVSHRAEVTGQDVKLSEGLEISFGRQKLRVIETPGHTNTCLCFLVGNLVFTGDTLLIRGTGRTDFQGGSSEMLYKNITEKLFQLPKESIVYPAHDYKGFTSSTIGAEMNFNPRVRIGKSKIEFIQIMDDLKLAYPKKIDIALPANLRCGAIEAK